MKKAIITATTLMSLFSIIACTENALTEDIQTPGNDVDIKEICITGKDFQYEDETRSSVTIGESGTSFTWDEDDVIGIFPNEGDQVSFAMECGAGTQTATFSGGGWALKSSSKYAAYYPHVYENRDMTKIPVSYLGQTQNGNANTDHIGAYDFMAAGVSTPANGAVAFDMQHLGALVQLTITVPEPSTVSKVVLTSSVGFTQTGTIDLTDPTPAIISDMQSSCFEIALNNVTTTETNERVTLYFMTAPINLTDCEFKGTIYFDDAPTREVEFIGKHIQAGRAYKVSTEDSHFLNYVDEYGVNHGQGVEIDGIVWAPVNCGYHSTDYMYGKLYQWGRKYGQGYDGHLYDTDANVIGDYCDALAPSKVQSPTGINNGQAKENENKFYCSYTQYRDWCVPSDNQLWNSGSETDPIKTTYDPCPDGWRVPTSSELSVLIKNRSEWTAEEGVNGYWFSGSVPYSSTAPRVFFPASGGRYIIDDGLAVYRGFYGEYWSSTPASQNNGAYFLHFHPTYANMTDFYRAYGYSVRCVQEQ